jgi:hypothetical protein
MKTTIIFVSILIFFVFGASTFYAQRSYMRYLSLVPKGDPVGLITRIRASLQFTNDPDNPTLPDERRACFRRARISTLIAIFTIIVGILFILLLRAFGLQEILDQ